MVPRVYYMLAFFVFLSVENLSEDGTFGGNDSIVAFSRHNDVDVIIHQFNSPTFIIDGGVNKEKPNTSQIHLAYHNMEHYSSLRRLNDPGTGPAINHHRRLHKQDKNMGKSEQDNSKNKQSRPHYSQKVEDNYNPDFGNSTSFGLESSDCDPGGGKDPSLDPMEDVVVTKVRKITEASGNTVSYYL